MSDLKSFLDWFEGYTENIEGAPNTKQWERILSRVKTLTPGTADVSMAKQTAPDQPKPTPAKRRPRTEKEWRDQYIQTMMEMGVDEESAGEFAANAGADLSTDPDLAARTEVGDMMN